MRRRQFLTGLVGTAVIAAMPSIFKTKRVVSKMEVMAKLGMVKAITVSQPGLFAVGDLIEIGGRQLVIARVGPNATMEVSS